MKATLSELKSKLDFLEKTMAESTENVEKTDGQQSLTQNYEKRIKEIVEIKPEEIIRINVGGKRFATRLTTLMSVKDNLFHKMVLSKKFDFSKEIFIDRSPEYFPMILDYLRNKKFDMKKLNKDQLLEIKEEIIYYELLEIEAMFNNLNELVTYVKLENTKSYSDSTGQVGGNDPMFLLDKNLNTGICTDNGGAIILELSKECEFEEIDIGGYIGKADWVLSDGYGSGANILTSVDRVKWTIVGTIPTGFGTSIVSTKVIRSKAKYIKMEHHSWIGLGYFKIKNLI
jgi:hypothetical protein